MAKQPQTDGEDDMGPSCSSSKGYKKGGMVTGKHGHKKMKSDMLGHKEMNGDKLGHKPMKKTRGA